MTSQAATPVETTMEVPTTPNRVSRAMRIQIGGGNSMARTNSFRIERNNSGHSITRTNTNPLHQKIERTSSLKLKQKRVSSLLRTNSMRLSKDNIKDNAEVINFFGIVGDELSDSLSSVSSTELFKTKYVCHAA